MITSGPEERDQRAAQHDGSRGTPAKELVVPSSRERDRHERWEGDRRGDKPSVDRIEPVLVLEEEVEEQRDAEQGESECTEPDEHPPEGLDLAQPFERERERDWELALIVALELAEHRELLVLAPGRLPQQEDRGGQGEPDHSDDEERPAPAVGSTDGVGDPTDRDRTHGSTDRRRDADEG